MVRTETSTDWATRLLETVGHAARLLDRLQPQLAEPDNSGPDVGTIGRYPPESKEPWSIQVASAYWDLYFGCGEVARAMRGAAGLKLPLFNDVHGHDAVGVIRNMIPASAEWILRGATHKLGKLVAAAESVPSVDESEPWVALPHRPGGRPLACPYCRTFGLRMLKRKGEVRCFYPGCADADGKPTRARMEPGRMSGEERLIFGDGTMMGGEA